MSRVIANINTASGGDTWQVALNKMNDTINAISVECVTINTHANGALTTGNGFVEGVYGSRTLVANTLRGGTVQTPGVLTISSSVNTSGAATTIRVGDVIINTTDISINSVPIAQISGSIDIALDTTGTSDQLVYAFDKLKYRGGEYTLTIKDMNANAFQISKLLLVQDSGDSYMTEFAVIWSNTNLGVFSSNVDATDTRVYITPTVSSTHISGYVELIEV